ncbi:hypothetical protein A0J61_00432 [Choanephora cucurbitarum]|uniref:HAUS augmin-like complex subunit 6 N-terminal domain-containing protein n=1 Tax=Choanephora cucurbitarum TaxID=101091 RepID=A0A1C7NQU4_9FUNG|nr:hypothetical protein A0J61_00432 [Choanephora cucurbitarum]
MFTYSHALVVCLNLLGLQGSIPTQNPYIQVCIDESLFLDPEKARLHFMTITFYLFCCLDFQRAFSSLKPYWPTESRLEEKKYIQNALAWLEELDQSGCLLSYVPLTNVFFTECAGPVMQKIMFVFSLTVMQRLIDNNFKTDLPAAQSVDPIKLKAEADYFSKQFLEVEENALYYDNTDERHLYFEKTIIQHLKTYPLREGYMRAIKSYLEQGCHYYRTRKTTQQSKATNIYNKHPSHRTTAYFDSTTRVDDTKDTQNNSMSYKQKTKQLEEPIPPPSLPPPTMYRKPSDTGFHFTKPKDKHQLKNPFHDNNTSTLLKQVFSDSEEDEDRVEVGRGSQIKDFLSPPQKRDIRAALMGIKRDKGKEIEAGFRFPIEHRHSFQPNQLPVDPICQQIESQNSSRSKRKHIHLPEYSIKRIHRERH